MRWAPSYRAESFGARVAAWSLKSGRAVATLWLAVIAVASIGVYHLQIDTTTDSVLERKSAKWNRYQESQERFGGDETIVVLVRGDTPFSPEALVEVSYLTRIFEGAPNVRRVDSLASVPVIRVLDDGVLSLDPAVDRHFQGSSNQVREALKRDRIAPRNLVSEDARSFAINIVLEDGSDPSLPELLSLVRDHAGKKGWAVSGVPVFREEATARTRLELFKFVPTIVALVFLISFVLFRSARIATVPIVCGSAATWVALGLMGCAGYSLTVVSVILPTIFLALSAAYSMHLITRVSRRVEKESRQAEVLSVAFPVSLSGTTTSLGFLGLAASNIDAIREFGAIASAGTLLVTLSVLTIGPVLLSRWSNHLVEPRGDKFFRFIAVTMVRRFVARRWVSVGLLVAACFAASVGLARVNVETDVVTWFSETDSIRQDYDEIREKLAGISPMNVEVDAGINGSVLDSRVLSAIDSLSKAIEDLPQVGRTISLADPLRQLNGEFAGDETQPLPESAATAEQYLLMLESVEEIDDLVVPDRRFSNVLIRADDNSSKVLMGIANFAEEWWEKEGPVGTSATTTGVMFEFARAEEEMTWGLVRGLFLATLPITIALALAFRSLKLATIGLFTNIVPILACFGFLGWIGYTLDLGTILVASMALGIAVDDTIQVIEAYEKQGASGVRKWSLKMSRGLTEVLPAIALTTLVIGCGFGILGFSGLRFTRDLGLLTVGILTVCVFVDVIVLPAIIRVTDRRISYIQ